MPVLRFEAWMNALSQTDPGHLTMRCEETGHTFEFEMGKSFTQPASGISRFPESVNYGGPKPAQTKDLDYSVALKRNNFNKQLMKCLAADGRFRFTHMFFLNVTVTEDERTTLLGMAEYRGARGKYNFAQEAQKEHPLCTRCLTLLEDLSLIWGHQMPVSKNSLDLLMKFQQQFPNECGVVANDPLIAV